MEGAAAANYCGKRLWLRRDVASPLVALIWDFCRVVVAKGERDVTVENALV